MTAIILSCTEMELLSHFIAELEFHHSVAGCNEMEIKDTPRMRVQIEAAEHQWQEKHGVPEEERWKPGIRNGRIQTQDHMILDYLKERLGV